MEENIDNMNINEINIEKIAILINWISTNMQYRRKSHINKLHIDEYQISTKVQYRRKSNIDESPKSIKLISTK